MQQPTKIVFLDYEGVILTARSQSATADNTPHRTVSNDDASVPDPVAIRFLNDLCSSEDTAVVIISSYKTHDGCKELLINSGFTGRIHSDWRTADGPTWNQRRGQGIDHWLIRHPEIVEYVIFEDSLSFLLAKQLPHIVPCDGFNGITYQNMEQARHILHGAQLDPFLETRWQSFELHFTDDPFVLQLKQTYLEQYKAPLAKRPPASTPSADDPPIQLG